MGNFTGLVWDSEARGQRWSNGWLFNRRYTQMNADEYQILLATDTHGHTQTKLNVVTFNFN